MKKKGSSVKKIGAIQQAAIILGSAGGKRRILTQNAAQLSAQGKRAADVRWAKKRALEKLNEKADGTRRKDATAQAGAGTPSIPAPGGVHERS